MFDAVKNYLALANGVTEVTRQRAVSAAKALVASGEATAEQVSNLADDLLTTSRNNRDTVLALVRYEIDRALVRLGLATSEEISSLAQRLASVESMVREALSSLGTSGTAAADPSADDVDETPPPRPTKRATKTARKAPAKRSPAKRPPAKRVAGTAGGSTEPAPRASDDPAREQGEGAGEGGSKS
jgi:polyhydroxyalkanoate synthesis regulator phasin